MRHGAVSDCVTIELLRKIRSAKSGFPETP